MTAAWLTMMAAGSKRRRNFKRRPSLLSFATHSAEQLQIHIPKFLFAVLQMDGPELSRTMGCISLLGAVTRRCPIHQNIASS